MKDIRQLTGKEALKYKKASESSEVMPSINPIIYVLAETRVRIIEKLNKEPSYFYQRHRYPNKDRRLLDQMFIYSIENDDNVSANKHRLINQLRYRYLKFIYRSEANLKIEWIRVTSHADKNLIYVWHEDVDEYHEQQRHKQKTQLAL